MPCRVLAIAAIATALTSVAAHAGPVTFLTALPIGQGQAVVRVQYLTMRVSDDPAPADRKMTVHAAPVTVALGITPRLAVFGSIVVSGASLTANTPAGRVTREARGLGDALVFARYTVYSRDTMASTFRVAPFGGIKLPTGAHERADGLGPLPPALQLGTGSWDGVSGVAVTWQTRQWEIDADFAYQRTTSAGGARRGDEASTDVSFQYRVWPTRLGGGVPGFVYAVAETNVVRQDRTTMAGGGLDPDSGGTRWDVDLGMQFVTVRYVIEGVVQVPVVDRPNGNGLGAGLRLVASLRWNFSLPF